MKNLFLFSTIIVFNTALFSAHLEDKACIIVDNAIKENKLYHYNNNIRKKASNFYSFKYQVPKSIKNKEYSEFHNSIKKIIEEKKLCGPKNRPLVIIPIIKSESLDEKESNISLRPFYKNDFSDFGNYSF